MELAWLKSDCAHTMGTQEDNMDQKEVGITIKKLREENAWTQEHLAGAANISVRTIQRAEDGVLSAESFSAIAGALNVPRDTGGITQSLNVRVKDVDKHFDQVKSAKAKIISEPQSGYGYRTYSVEDPEGHIWKFLSPLI